MSLGKRKLLMVLSVTVTIPFVACVNNPRLSSSQSERTISSASTSLSLSFIVDKQYDQDHLISMFLHNDPAGLESRAKSMGLDPKVARAIRDAKNQAEAEEIAFPLVDKAFQEHESAITAAKQEFEALWTDLLRTFSDIVIQTTESPWLHNHYTCVVSAFHPGLSNWSGNMVAVKYDSKPVHKRRILAHEILLSDVFQIFRKAYSPSDISDRQVWAFSEITAVFILDNPKLRTYWPNFPSAGDYFKNSNYPQLSALEKELKIRFDNRASFEQYMRASAPILREFLVTKHRSAP